MSTPQYISVPPRIPGSSNTNTSYVELLEIDALIAPNLQSNDTGVGFYGTAPIAQQSSVGVTTVAQIVTILNNLGLTHP